MPSKKYKMLTIAMRNKVINFGYKTVWIDVKKVFSPVPLSFFYKCIAKLVLLGKLRKFL